VQNFDIVDCQRGSNCYHVAWVLAASILQIYAVQPTRCSNSSSALPQAPQISPPSQCDKLTLNLRRCASRIVSPNTAAVTGPLLQRKHESTMKSIFLLQFSFPCFIQQSWNANLQLPSRPCTFRCMTKLAFKQYQFFFQYYLPIPVKKVHCSQKLDLPMSTTNNICRDSITEV